MPAARPRARAPVQHPPQPRCAIGDAPKRPWDRGRRRNPEVRPPSGPSAAGALQPRGGHRRAPTTQRPRILGECLEPKAQQRSV
eukprot:5736977-Alexandrium_andersonii.AAC.1